MSKPKRRRYLTEKEIVKRIDTYQTKYRKYIDAALALESNAEVIAKSGDSIRASGWRKQADRKRISASRISLKILPRLKAKLAEFMTEPIPGVLPDRSVEA